MQNCAVYWSEFIADAFFWAFSSQASTIKSQIFEESRQAKWKHLRKFRPWLGFKLQEISLLIFIAFLSTSPVGIFCLSKSVRSVCDINLMSTKSYDYFTLIFCIVDREKSSKLNSTSFFRHRPTSPTQIPGRLNFWLLINAFLHVSFVIHFMFSLKIIIELTSV